MKFFSGKIPIDSRRLRRYRFGGQTGDSRFEEKEKKKKSKEEKYSKAISVTILLKKEDTAVRPLREFPLEFPNVTRRFERVLLR